MTNVPDYNLEQSELVTSKVNSSSEVVPKQLFDVLNSLDTENASNKDIETLKLQIMVLMKNKLPYSNDSIPWTYHKSIISNLNWCLSKISQDIVDPTVIKQLKVYLQALCELSIQYRHRNNVTEWEYTIEWLNSNEIKFTPNFKSIKYTNKNHQTA